MTKTPSWRPLLILLLLAGVAQLVSISLGRLHSPEATRIGEVAAFADPRAPSSGAADAIVTIILFSDYACPSCRAQHHDLQALLARNPALRIIYRDWPVFGPRSRNAARLAIASQWQGRHAAFDDELMRRGGTLDDAALRAAADRAEIDWPRLQADLAAHGSTIDALLADTARLARESGLVGTPTMIIGTTLVAGRQSAAQLQAMVAASRASGGQGGTLHSIVWRAVPKMGAGVPPALPEALRRWP